MIFFGLTKLLAFLPFGNFFGSALGKIVLLAGVVLVGFIGFKFWLSAHDEAVRQEALVAWNQAQIEQTERDRAEYQSRLEEVQEEQFERLTRLQDERDALARRNAELIGRIRGGEFDGADKPSTEVLREAVRSITQGAE